jgi:hypothetical protein
MSTLKLLLALLLLDTAFPLCASATATYTDLTAFLMAAGCTQTVQGCPSGELAFESFESNTATGQPRTALPIGTDLFTITPLGMTLQSVFDTASNQGPVDGSKYVSALWEDGATAVTFNLTQPTKIFGLTIRDFEEPGQLRISGGAVMNFACATNPPDGGNASTVFCGIISDTPFTQVVVETTGLNDSLGFDATYVPEPGTGFLVAAGLLGLSFRSRSRSPQTKACHSV